MGAECSPLDPLDKAFCSDTGGDVGERKMYGRTQARLDILVSDNTAVRLYQLQLAKYLRHRSFCISIYGTVFAPERSCKAPAKRYIGPHLDQRRGTIRHGGVLLSDVIA